MIVCIQISFTVGYKLFLSFWISCNCDFKKEMGRTHARPLPYLCSLLYPVSFIQLWNFSLTLFFRPHYGPGVGVASNSIEYQEYYLGGKGSQCIVLTTFPPSCADCLEIWEPQPPGTLRVCPGLYRDCFYYVLQAVFSIFRSLEHLIWWTP
jgi:hypothetical protein